jgi:3',5'-cyclic AMP phosphodiesterase CpdA
MNAYSRRAFLRQLIGTGALITTGFGEKWALGAPAGPQAFRFAFLTDLHLLKDGDLRSDIGIATCLAAVEALQPKPEFILVGGDLVDRARDLTPQEATRRLNQFQQIWNDHTGLPAHWCFGNHDLVGTNNPDVSSSDPLYATGLFQRHFHLRKLFYSFDHKGWHFIVLDDIALDSDHSYYGALFDEEIKYFQADLEAHRTAPTIICTHIPLLSNTPLAAAVAKLAGLHFNVPKNLVCTNASAVTSDLAGHNVRAVLCGHLHYYEKLEFNGVPFINSGAVCGSYWRGKVANCPEGYGLVDVGADGSFNFKYQTYGWQAAV